MIPVGEEWHNSHHPDRHRRHRLDPQTSRRFQDPFISSGIPCERSLLLLLLLLLLLG